MSASVLIIGSGTAGLSAARCLYQNGWRNVKILEAQNFIGGRVNTLSYGSSGVELGAQWIHGQKGNAVYEIAKINNLVDDDAPNFISSVYNFLQLKSEKEKDVAADVCHFFKRNLECCASEESKSLGEVLNERFCTRLNEKDCSLEIRKLREAVFDWNLRFETSITGCYTLHDVSANLFEKYIECEGNPVTELRNNYSSFINILKSGIPQDWLVLGSEVKKIQWSSDEKLPAVKATTAGGFVFVADHVIITVPVGYLKHNMKGMFEPSLPILKQEAIHAIGYGIVNKVFLHFDSPFWKTGDVFNVLWLNLPEEKPGKEECWTRDIIHFTYVLNQPHILCVWVAGEGARQMEQIPIEEVGKACHKVLCHVLGNPHLPRHTETIRSCWYSNPFFCGSYCYLSMECEKKQLYPDYIAEPVLAPREKHLKYLFLQFAGEGTHDRFFSTVHGAYETGIREANRLITFYSPASANINSRM